MIKINSKMILFVARRSSCWKRGYWFLPKNPKKESLTYFMKESKLGPSKSNASLKCYHSTFDINLISSVFVHINFNQGESLWVLHWAWRDYFHTGRKHGTWIILMTSMLERLNPKDLEVEHLSNCFKLRKNSQSLRGKKWFSILVLLLAAGAKP